MGVLPVCRFDDHSTLLESFLTLYGDYIRLIMI